MILKTVVVYLLKIHNQIEDSGIRAKVEIIMFAVSYIDFECIYDLVLLHKRYIYSVLEMLWEFLSELYICSIRVAL